MQPPGSHNFTLRTSVWDQTSYGYVGKDNFVDLLMIGGGMSEGTSSTAPVPGAPACTHLSYGWCKFPYCGFPEPAWKPWPGSVCFPRPLWPVASFLCGLFGVVAPFPCGLFDLYHCPHATCT